MQVSGLQRRCSKKAVTKMTSQVSGHTSTVKTIFVLNKQGILFWKKGPWDGKKRKIGPSKDPGPSNCFQGLTALPGVQS